LAERGIVGLSRQSRSAVPTEGTSCGLVEKDLHELRIEVVVEPR
jgi:hypothetical protein